MLSAAALSKAIRAKRKKMKGEGVDKMVDTAPLPQMNPQDILNNKMNGQIEEMLDVPEKSEASSDPADEDISGTSQDKEALKKRMARVKAILNGL